MTLKMPKNFKRMICRHTMTVPHALPLTSSFLNFLTQRFNFQFSFFSLTNLSYLCGLKIPRDEFRKIC